MPPTPTILMCHPLKSSRLQPGHIASSLRCLQRHLPVFIPCSMHCNLINVPSVMQPRRDRKCHSSKHSDFSDDDNDLSPAVSEMSINCTNTFHHSTFPRPRSHFSHATHPCSKPPEKTPPTATTSTPAPAPSPFAQHQQPTSQCFERSCKDHTHRRQNFSFKAI